MEELRKFLTWVVWTLALLLAVISQGELHTAATGSILDVTNVHLYIPYTTTVITVLMLQSLKIGTGCWLRHEAFSFLPIGVRFKSILKHVYILLPACVLVQFSQMLLVCRKRA